MLPWLVLVLLPGAASAQDTPAAWFSAEMKQLVTAPDIWWIADNTSHRRPEEPFTRYALHWTTRDGGHTLSGELVAIDSTGRRVPMWSYRMYWHPGERRGYLMQTSSWGAYAIGPMEVDSTGGIRTILNEQEIWQPDGAAAQIRHRSWFEGGTTHMTESFDWQDGRWTPTRAYRWIRGRLD